MSQKSFVASKGAWMMVGIVGFFFALQIIADVSASKLVMLPVLGGLVIPGGSMVYAITFTWRDLMHKELGKQATQVAIILAGFTKLFAAGYFALVAALPFPPFWGYQDAFQAILGAVPGIVLASIVAMVVSELLDTEIYQGIVNRLGSRFQWVRVVGSNFVSVPVDSILFGGLAFVVFPMILGGQEPQTLAGLWAIVKGQSMFKWVIAAIMLPTIYVIKERGHGQPTRYGV